MSTNHYDNDEDDGEKWTDDPPADWSWSSEPSDPPPAPPDTRDGNPVSIEKVGAGAGAELREQTTGAWLSSSRVDRLEDVVDPDEDLERVDGGGAWE